MARNRQRSRGQTSSSGSFLQIAILLLLLAAVGFIAYVAWTGSLPAWLRKDEPEKREEITIPPGMIAVPISPRVVPAYTKMRREHLWSPEKEAFAFIAMDEDQVPEGVITKVGGLLGRVLRKRKPSGFVFTEDDFYPKGTRAGLVAAIPPGMRSMRVTTSQIRGVHDLRPGDRFDVVAARTVKTTKPQLGSLVVDAQVTAMIDSENRRQGEQADVTVLVRDGIVIDPVRIREEPRVGRSISRGSYAQTLPIPELVIAVHPDEVTKLAQAFAVGASVWCTARSGRPDGEDAEVNELRTPSALANLMGSGGAPGATTASMVERISGVDRSWRIVSPDRGTRRGGFGDTPGIENMVGRPAPSGTEAGRDSGETPASVSEEK